MQEAVDIRLISTLEPISSIGHVRLRQLLEFCHLETVERGEDPFRLQALQGQCVYLLSGELEVVYADSHPVLVRAESEWARHPIGKRQSVSVTATTRSQLLRVDDDLLDQMVTWDQFAGYEKIKSSELKEVKNVSLRRFLDSGMFSAGNLSNSPLALLPPANIGKLLIKINVVEVWNKEVIFREGEPGDCYYLMESGRAQSTHSDAEGRLISVGLKSGDVFGAEGLVRDEMRSASVTMKSNGVLLRLKKHDFFELMNEPSLILSNYSEAAQKVAQGAVWLDVRHPAEYRHDKLSNAINLPLSVVRNASSALQKSTSYVAYCQSGRRSAAAASLLAQAGYQVDVLENGLWSVPVLQQ